MAQDPRHPLNVPRLLLITGDEEPLLLLTRVERLLACGPCDLLLRTKGRGGRFRFDLATALLERLEQSGGRLLVGGAPDVALAVGAHGVHLPESELPTSAARKLLGHGRLLGRSCHSVAGACSALAEGADYVTLSPLFATASHPGATPLGLERFGAMVAAIPGPVLALGGITPENSRQALERGAHGVALIRGVFSAPDPSGPFLVLKRMVDQEPAPKFGEP